MPEDLNQPLLIIDQWASFFNNGDLDGIMNLYHDNSTLLPTFLPNLLSTPEQIENYFVRTLEGQASVEIDE